MIPFLTIFLKNSEKTSKIGKKLQKTIKNALFTVSRMAASRASGSPSLSLHCRRAPYIRHTYTDSVAARRMCRIRARWSCR